MIDFDRYTEDLDQWRERRKRRRKADKQRKMLAMTRRDIIERVQSTGPNRVVVDGNGFAVNPREARDRHAVESDIVFVRKDGWMLGAPIEFYNVAKEMWKDEWIWELDQSTWELKPFQEGRQ